MLPIRVEEQPTFSARAIWESFRSCRYFFMFRANNWRQSVIFGLHQRHLIVIVGALNSNNLIALTYSTYSPYNIYRLERT
jgi:hypothetical protein